MKFAIKSTIAAVLTAAIAISTMTATFAANNTTDPVGRDGFIECKSPGIDVGNGKRELPSLVIVVGFYDAAHQDDPEKQDNLPYHDDYDWHETFFGDKDSVKSYYEAQSYGQFTFTEAEETSGFGKDGNTNIFDEEGDGVVHVTLPVAPHNENYGFQITSDAIKACEPYVDFSKYDIGDGEDGKPNGHIDNNELIVSVVYAGYEERTEANNYVDKANHMRVAHYWALPDKYKATFPISENATAQNNNTITVDEYIRVSENIRRTKDGVDMQSGAQCIVHETAHYLGVPDYYAIQNKDAAGDWAEYQSEAYSIMSRPYGVALDSSGSPMEWETAPYSMDPWTKIKLNWIKPTVIKNPGTYTLAAVNGENPEILRINIDDNNLDEYYLIENRQYTGWDAGMKYDSKYVDNSNGGIIVWHIDESAIKQGISNYSVNEYNHRPGIMPLFIERDTLRGQAPYYSFLGDEPLFNCGVHDYDSLRKYNLTRIQLPKYNGAELRNGREYSTISIIPGESGSKMDLKIVFDEDDYPQRNRKVYFDNNSFGYLKPSVAFDRVIFNYNIHEEITMDHVKDNIYCAFIPEGISTFCFYDGDNSISKTGDLSVDHTCMLYDGTEWTDYHRTSIKVKRGDVNGDDKVDINDVTRLQRHLSWIDQVPLIREAAMDADRNRIVTIEDATQIQKYLAEELFSWHKVGNNTSSAA